METFNTQDLYTIIITTTIVLLIIGVFLVVYILLYKKKEHSLIAKNLQQKQKFEATLLQTQIEIQEQTLKTISQEIHDNIGQVLSLANLNLNLVETDNPHNSTKIATATNLVNKAIQDLRDISRSLNTDNIQQAGLIAVIKTELEIIKKSGININFIAEGKEVKLLPQVELILFRMLQECINNSIKHAKANNINITAYYGIATVEFTIDDDGIGFNEATVKKGQGLNNLHNRSKFINANIDINSVENKGTTVRIEVPI